MFLPPKELVVCGFVVRVGLLVGGVVGAIGIGVLRAQIADGVNPASLPGYLSYMYGWDPVGVSWSRLAAAGGILNTLPKSSLATVIAGTTSATPNTFVVILAGDGGRQRRGCKVINKGTDIMYVFTGASGGTIPTSQILAAGTATADGGSYDCASSSGVPLANGVMIASPTANIPYLLITE